MNEFPVVDFKARPSRPMVGPSLWVFGALLWAYAVIGELVVRSDFPEPLGWLSLLFVLAVTWFFAVERSCLEDPPPPHERLRRTGGPLAAALGLWLLTVVFITVVGSAASGDADGIVTVFLWLLGVGAFFVGRRLTSARHVPIDDSRRVLGILLWVGAAVVTVVALVPVLE